MDFRYLAAKVIDMYLDANFSHSFKVFIDVHFSLSTLKLKINPDCLECF